MLDSTVTQECDCGEMLTPIDLREGELERLRKVEADLRKTLRKIETLALTRCRKGVVMSAHWVAQTADAALDTPREEGA